MTIFIIFIRCFVLKYVNEIWLFVSYMRLIFMVMSTGAVICQRRFISVSEMSDSYKSLNDALKRKST